jgi:hypothetical protein
MAVRFAGAYPTYNHSAIGNPSNSEWMWVDLPVINDSIYGEITNSEVRVVDQHYSSEINCQLISVKRNNSGGYDGIWGRRAYSSASGVHLQSMDTRGASSGSGWGGRAYHEYLNCSLPPTYSGNPSYIVSYYVRED